MWLRDVYYARYSLEMAHHAKQHGTDTTFKRLLQLLRRYAPNEHAADSDDSDDIDEENATDSDDSDDSESLPNIWKFLTEVVYNDNKRKFFGADEMLRLGLCDGIGSMRFVTSISEVFDAAIPLSPVVQQKDSV